MMTMVESLGCLCLVLHGHLPFVLNHGNEIHGEPWLYEAAAETYLPILGLLDELSSQGRSPKFTIGLTPILLEQLRHRRFQEGFIEYIGERAERARQDGRGFDTAGEVRIGELAGNWERFYQNTAEQFERLDRDIVAGFARHWGRGSIEVLTSAATHPYMPLLLTDQSIVAQMNLGTHTTRRHFGKNAAGMWLPECAYRPAVEQWKPPLVFQEPVYRPGLEKFMADQGIDHFFVDGHMFENGEPIAARDNDEWHTVDRAHLHLDPTRGWRQQLSAVGVISEFTEPSVFAFARHPLVSEQVWSATVGYPGSPEYLDFHRRHGSRGLRYHKVTDSQGDLGSKQPYIPADADKKIREHAEHFCDVIRRILQQYKEYTGQPGIITAPFDAELFGHWWFEGPRFLRRVIEIISDDRQIQLLTSVEALEKFGSDKAMRLPDASWGKYGNNSTWFNDRTQWIWEIEYRAEARLVEVVKRNPILADLEQREVLTDAARQLLLMQASDWPFILHSQAAADYAIQRFAAHATNFDRALSIYERIAAGRTITEVQRAELTDMRVHDDVFAEIDLNWWR